MNRKKFIVSGILMCTVFFVASIASATSWISADVARTRTVDGTASIMLKYVTGSGCTWGAGDRPDNVWFVVPSSMNDQALAISLTAISLGQTVRVGIEQCPSPGNETGTVSSVGLDAM